MSETDRRLKDYLNTNQAARERMCLEILATQPDYTDVRPRLPKGGPDGARDIECLHKKRLCFGAVGFVNDATDTDDHRKQAKKKFKDDLKSATNPNNESEPSPKAFVFLTNVGLTPGIIKSLKTLAYKSGVEACDIFDRERLRIALDSSRGYAIRLRYLDIPLSDAEQKDFFTTWGKEVDAAIGMKFRGIDQTTKRIQFLLESGLLLDQLGVRVSLEESIWEACKGEFFFQTSINLRVHSEGLLGWSFGEGTSQIDESLDEWVKRGSSHTSNSKYGFGFSSLIPGSPYYERLIDPSSKYESPKNVDSERARKEIRTFSSSSILEVDKSVIFVEALSAPFLDRFAPTCKLLELHGCWILFECSRELANKIKEITIFGNGYELLQIQKDEMRFEAGKYERLSLPSEAKQGEADHEWVTLRPAKMASCFTVDLMGATPRRYDWD